MSTRNPPPTPSDDPAATDRIVKRFEVAAPRARVWLAISDAKQFGAWFGASIDGPFELGTTVGARHTAPQYAHLTFSIEVERIEPEHTFAYRWHPYGVDHAVDYGVDASTLVEFHLEDGPQGTTVTITESGFDRVPVELRVESFRKNEAGWTSQSGKLAAFVA
jgi:uncharacterized protein YndB with AHSA1/START domain